LPFITLPLCPLPAKIALSHIERFPTVASTCTYLVGLLYLPFDLIVTLLGSIIFKETVYEPSPNVTSYTEASVSYSIFLNPFASSALKLYSFII